MTKRKRRKQLKRVFAEELYFATCGEHYHTTNPPPWDGYVIQDATMQRLRDLAQELKELWT